MKRDSMRQRAIIGAGVSMLGVFGCGGSTETARPMADPPSLAAFAAAASTPEAFLAHVGALSHDSMQGRGTGEAGGRMAAAYLEQAFQEAGLDPMPGATSFAQAVPIRATRVARATARLSGDAVDEPLDPEQISVVSRVDRDRVELVAPIVFVGAGVVAPGADWDDYAGRDVEGAFVVLHPDTPADLTERLPINAYELTGSGRAAAARERGALGLVTLSRAGSDEGFAASRAFAIAFEQRSSGWRPPQAPDFSVRLGPDATSQLLTAASTTWDASADGRSVVTELTIALSFEAETRRFDASNVVGIVRGESDETVVVTAHYDAYGIGPANAAGDSTYNGTTDNATGTAGLVEMARTLVNRPRPPARTVVFVATTAEETGKLGARYYVENPVGSLDAIALNINIDGLGFSPPTDDFALFPSAGTDVVDVLTELAAPLGMTFGLQGWHAGMHFNFDHEEFLTQGIVGMTIWQGENAREGSELPGEGGGPIHTPDDDLTRGWVDAGIEQHLELHRRIIEYYADGAEPPRFVEGHPFGSRAGSP